MKAQARLEGYEPFGGSTLNWSTPERLSFETSSHMALNTERPLRIKRQVGAVIRAVQLTAIEAGHGQVVPRINGVISNRMGNSVSSLVKT